jgi:hypothetical protein
MNSWQYDRSQTRFVGAASTEIVRALRTRNLLFGSTTRGAVYPHPALLSVHDAGDDILQFHRSESSVLMPEPEAV